MGFCERVLWLKYLIYLLLQVSSMTRLKRKWLESIRVTFYKKKNNDDIKDNLYLCSRFINDETFFTIALLFFLFYHGIISLKDLFSYCLKDSPLFSYSYNSGIYVDLVLKFEIKVRIVVFDILSAWGWVSECCCIFRKPLLPLPLHKGRKCIFRTPSLAHQVLCPKPSTRGLPSACLNKL